MALFLLEATADQQKPDLSSFVTYVKRWESGDVQLRGPRHRAAYAKVFGIPEEELFGPRPRPKPRTAASPDATDRIRHAVRRPAALDGRTIDALAGRWSGNGALRTQWVLSPCSHRCSPTCPWC